MIRGYAEYAVSNCRRRRVQLRTRRRTRPPVVLVGWFRLRDLEMSLFDPYLAAALQFCLKLEETIATRGMANLCTKTKEGSL